MADRDQPKRVVGIALASDTGLPVVVMKGAGTTADWALGLADRNSTPVVRSPDLAAQLYRTPVDAPVARDLFPVMAALLCHVLRADQSTRESQT